MRSGAEPAPFGFTGELQSDDLVYLRARWYDPASGTFLGRDPFEGFSERPNTLHPYMYAGNNPVTFVDPTGQYFWEPNLEANSWSMDNTSNIQVRIQIMAMQGNIERIHAEYIVLPTRRQVDLLDSDTGEVWEIKPWDDAAQGIIEADRNIVALQSAQTLGLLKRTNLWNGKEYDWNATPASWYRGTTFTRTPVYLGRDATGYWDFFAAQTEPGLILWWKHRRSSREQVPHPILVPDMVPWSRRNIRPGWQPNPGLVPGYASSQEVDIVGGCIFAGGVAVAIGVTIGILVDPVPGDELAIPAVWAPILATVP